MGDVSGVGADRGRELVFWIERKSWVRWLRGRGISTMRLVLVRLIVW